MEGGSSPVDQNVAASRAGSVCPDQQCSSEFCPQCNLSTGKQYITFKCPLFTWSEIKNMIHSMHVIACLHFSSHSSPTKLHSCCLGKEYFHQSLVTLC